MWLSVPNWKTFCFAPKYQLLFHITPNKEQCQKRVTEAFLWTLWPLGHQTLCAGCAEAHGTWLWALPTNEGIILSSPSCAALQVCIRSWVCLDLKGSRLGTAGQDNKKREGQWQCEPEEKTPFHSHGLVLPISPRIPLQGWDATAQEKKGDSGDGTHMHTTTFNTGMQGGREGKRERGLVIKSLVSRRDPTFPSCIILISINTSWEPTPVESCDRHSARSKRNTKAPRTSLCPHSLEEEAKTKPNKTHQPWHQAWEFPSTFTNISVSPVYRTGEASVIWNVTDETKASLKIAELASGSPRIQVIEFLFPSVPAMWHCLFVNTGYDAALWDSTKGKMINSSWAKGEGGSGFSKEVIFHR